MGEIFGNSLRNWASAMGAGALVFVLAYAVKKVAMARLRSLASRTTTRMDDLVVEILAHARLFLLLVLAVAAGIRFLPTPVISPAIFHGIFVILMALQAGTWGSVAIRFLLDHPSKNGADSARAATMAAAGFLARIVLWVTLALLVLDNLGVNVTALLAGLGVGGVAVALAVQNVLGDLLASLSIVLDKPFVIGDAIQVGENVGVVEKIGLKTTRLKSITGEQLIYSNAELLRSNIRNWKRMQERRAQFWIGVAYETPPEKLRKVEEIVREAVSSHARFDRCKLNRLGASSLDFDAVYFVPSGDYALYADAQQKILLRILERFAQEGIDIAYPTSVTIQRPDR
ncbi:MAG: mechanosensitive ion channel family protein [Bdellovibrionales bacterium]|nr:mechanosensitive ion channel family protein [Bdellovibrionales bacterium]